QMYDAIVRQELGRSLPMLGTEGGFIPQQLPPSPEDAARRMHDAFDLVGRRDEPYNFVYSYWLIANEAGGGGDVAFTAQALFRLDGPTPLVDALKRLMRGGS